MNDESDLPKLQSIILGSRALKGDDKTTDWNKLIMKSIVDNKKCWLDLPSLSLLKGYNSFNNIGIVKIEGMRDDSMWYRSS